MKADKWIGAILTAFAVFMFYRANHLPPPLFGDVGAAFVPKIWFTLLFVCGVALTVTGIVRDWKNRALEAKNGTGQDTQSKTREFFSHYRYVFLGFIMFFAYILAMGYVGYLISTLAFMPALMWILGPKTGKSAAIIALTSVGVTSVIYYGFVGVLKVFLPSGRLF